MVAIAAGSNDVHRRSQVVEVHWFGETAHCFCGRRELCCGDAFDSQAKGKRGDQGVAGTASHDFGHRPGGLGFAELFPAAQPVEYARPREVRLRQLRSAQCVGR